MRQIKGITEKPHNLSTFPIENKGTTFIANSVREEFYIYREKGV